MCGIGGYTTKKDIKLDPVMAITRSNIAKGILIANESRGIDSTGIFLQNGKFHALSKDTCHATKFVREPDVIKLFKKDSCLMLGHTRQATTGAVTKQNAHPFIKGTITGVHNGMIFNDDELAKTHNFKIEVDSEVIFELLNKYKNNFVDAFKEIRGSVTIAWTDKKDPKTLYLLAHENPLSVAHVPFLDTIFFASEFSALDSCLQSGIGSENYNVWEAEQDVVYKLTSDHQLEKTKVKFSELASYNNYGNKNYYDSRDVDSPVIYDGADPLFKDIRNKDLKNETLKDDELIAEEIEYLKELAQKSGCAVCAKPLSVGFYFDESNAEVIYCTECVDDFGSMDMSWLDLKSGKISTL